MASGIHEPALNLSASQRSPALLLGATVVWGACLLFLVEPLSSKLILPWFGGSAAVWITCIVFFQSALLIGYLYAHLLSSFLPPRWQAAIHILLLGASALTLPIVPNARWQPRPGSDPTWFLLAVLATSVGLPYTLLSATSPLVQSWYARSNVGDLPYRYFALSNGGSLVALFSYPILVEPNLTSSAQAWSWSAGYLVFAALCIAIAWRHRETPRLSQPDGSREASPWILWIALAACPSALLLAVTSLLTENIAPMPLLWVLPLGVYLLTFILCFDSTGWYRRPVFLALTLPALACLSASAVRLRTGQIWLLTLLLNAALFICCMTCHGELVRLKPHPSRLTLFYVCLSVGGVIGGLFIALFAPHVFPAMFDYPISFIGCATLLLFVLWRERRSWIYPYQRALWSFGVLVTLAMSAYLANGTWHDLKRSIFSGRNFYGALRVQELRDDFGQPVRELVHGTITHGVQFLEAPWRARPTTYYTEDSGAGLAWRTLAKRGPLRMGAIGLGAGTLAAYGRAGDVIRFYEINPLVIDIAKRQFSFLSDSPAHVEVVPGDARLVLQGEPPQRFDLIVIDAFTGDAIPVHLLTAEALRLYSHHLRPDGILAFHLSNRYLNLAPVVAAAGSQQGFKAFQVENEDNDRQEVYSSSYMLLSKDASVGDDPVMDGKLIPATVPLQFRVWTDNFSDLWQVLKFDENE